MADSSALVICRADPNWCPRPRQMARMLCDRHRTTVLAPVAMEDPRVGWIGLPTLPLHGLPRASRIVRLLGRRYRSLLWNPELEKLSEQLRQQRFDLVVCHDLELLPLAAAATGQGVLVFDAQEYYPRHFEDRSTWRLLYAPFNQRLCRDHLSRCDLVLTVSEGLAAEYRRSFGVGPLLAPSLPPRHDIEPSAVDPSAIRMVHHGWANPSRKLENMIRMMDHVDRRFALDLILKPLGDRYFRSLSREADRRSNVSIRPPVPYERLIPETAGYDVGVYILEPASFNLRHALPNKFFEFIQARLAVAIGPSPEMRALVERYGCGVVAADFDPRSLAAALNALSAEQIEHLKARSHQAASLLNAEANSGRLLAEIDRLLAAGPEAPP